MPILSLLIAAVQPTSSASALPTPRLIAGSITNLDYPVAAAQARGTTVVRLGIGANGRITACEMTASSGNAVLDRTTCMVMQRRFRFEPTTATSVSRCVTWAPPASGERLRPLTCDLALP